MSERTRAVGLSYEHAPDCGAHKWIVRILTWGLSVLGAIAMILIGIGFRLNTSLGEINASLRVTAARVDTMTAKVDRIDDALVRHLTKARE